MKGPEEEKKTTKENFFSQAEERADSKEVENTLDPQQLTTLQALLGEDIAEAAGEVVKVAPRFLEALIQRQVDKSALEAKALENQIEIGKLELEAQKERYSALRDEQKFITGFDIRNKLHSTILLVIFIAFLLLVYSLNAINETVLTAFIGVISTIIAIGNKDVLKDFLMPSKEKKPNK